MLNASPAAAGSDSADRLAVWGDPIAHSRSPQLHSAAYRVLGKDWTYSRHRVSAAGFLDEVARLDERWRGLSLTMPLKEEARRFADEVDRAAMLTGSVNTLLLTGGVVRGANTDVPGLAAALREVGVRAPRRARVLGAGATAGSAVLALRELQAEEIEIVARDSAKAAALVALGEEAGARMRAVGFDAAFASADVTVSTLPGGAVLPPDSVTRLTVGGGILFDVAYSPWPSALAASWNAAPAHSGLGMLLHQAVRQVRMFVTGATDTPLDDEQDVVNAMRAVLVGD